MVTKQQSNYLKLIGILTMLIDHIGYMLYPDILVLRIIGRISFPIFAFQVGIGYVYTKNLFNYLKKLLIYGVIVQTIYSFFYGFNHINILITLFIGLLCIYLYDKKKYYLIILLCLVIYFFNKYGINIDYGIYGVLTILTFYIFRYNKYKIFISLLLLTLLYSYFNNNFVQIFSIVSLIFIFIPMNVNIKISNMFFYLFYPFHFLVLFILKKVLIK